MPIVSARSLVVLGVIFACLLLTTQRPKAEDYPSRPIKLLVGASPGGTTDTVARALAEPMASALRQPVVVENRPGAGGNLAAALAMMARDRLGPPLAGQILLSPMLDAGLATCSIRDADAGPVGCKWADGWATYLGVPDKAAHPYAAPACGTRLHGLPPALVLTTPDDAMRDEALDYARRLRDAGVALHVRALAAHNWPDALAGPAHPDWARAVRTNFAEFFAAVTPNLVPVRAADAALTVQAAEAALRSFP